MAEEQGGWTIDEYTTEGGESPVRAFISGLSGRDEVDAVALSKLLEERGNTLRPPHVRRLQQAVLATDRKEAKR